MSAFEFATAARVVFGAGTLAQLPALVEGFGRHALLVTGRGPANADRVAALLDARHVDVTRFAVGGEPTVEVALAGVAAARASGADFVVAVGGGSALDTGKAVAALATNPGDPLTYLEVVGAGQPLARTPLPVAAIPTTAGTGSEVTRNAVLGVPGRRLKVSLRSAAMLPRLALLDPDLTLDLPRALTVSTGLDALTQLIEPFVSSRATPFTDALCVAGIRRAASALPRAAADGHDRQARESMALASLWGGMALANAGLGAVHGLAGPLGGMTGAPHGALCAALLPYVVEANLAALPHDHPARGRFDEIARMLTGRDEATAPVGVDHLFHLMASLGTARLGALGVTAADAREAATLAASSSSMKGNPVPLDHDTLCGIVTAAI